MAPWDNPTLTPEQQAAFRAAYDVKFGNQALEHRASALTVPTYGESPVEGPQGGCESGGLVPSLGLVGLALLATLTRRRSLLAVTLVAGTAGVSRATEIAYGFVAYWDSRALGSDATGSRLDDCVETDTTCVLGDSDCCVRPVRHARVEVWQGFTLYDTYDVQDDGVFVMDITGANLTSELVFYLRYNRAIAPGPLKISISPTATAAAAPVAYQRWKRYLPSGPGPFYQVSELRVNSSGETTSVNGDYASLWETLTSTEEALAVEGDHRFERLHNEPNTDPYDPILVRYTGVKERYWHCAGSYINTFAENARLASPAAQFGQVYMGRVTGCSTTTFQPGGSAISYNAAIFPPNPNVSQTYSGQSEGVALTFSIPQVVTYLTFWNPNSAALADVKATMGGCTVDTLPNNNEAAHLDNTALALWEFLDNDTSGANGGVDDCSRSMEEVMDALLYGQANAGTLDNQASEATYTPVVPSTCLAANSNEDCAVGDVCLRYYDGTSMQSHCFTGDVHGSNIDDFTYWLSMLGLSGNEYQTLLSSACLGTPDTTYAYTRGFRDD